MAQRIQAGGRGIGRRDFIAAAAALAAPLPVMAQPVAPRVAWLSPTRAADGSVFLDELREGLRALGYVEPRSLLLEPYWGEESGEKTAALIATIIQTNPRVIVSQGAAAVALRRANTAIPIVFGYSGDPIEAGLVESMPRPGGTMTGISYMTLELMGKRLELLKEVLPDARRIGVLSSPMHPGDRTERQASETAGRLLGLDLEFHEQRNRAELTAALAAMAAARVDAVMMFPVQSIIIARQMIADWSVAHRIPAISGWAQFAQGGNFMSYGPNLRDASRRLAAFVDRILKGAKPAELPVELPARVELVINLQAAKALGITVPAALISRADEVIE